MNWKSMFFGIIGWSIVGFLIYQKDWTGLALVSCFTVYFIAFDAIKSIKIKKRMIQSSFIIGFISVFVNIFVGSWILRYIYLMFLISGVLMAKNMPRKKGNYTTLHNKIKQELNINFVKSYKKKFPKSLSFIGGFMSPIMPIFTFVNKRWRHKKTKEAIIHENIHIWLLLHKNWLIYLLFYILATSAICSYIFNLSITLGILLQIFFMASFLVYFEKVTFDYTHELGKKYKIKTRKFTKRLTRNYFIIYSIQISCIAILLLALYGLYELIKMIICFIGGLV